jgi:hypothetical protein
MGAEKLDPGSGSAVVDDRHAQGAIRLHQRQRQSRPAHLVHRPDNTAIDLNYGSSGSADDAINRLKQLKSGSNVLVDYSYLGQVATAPATSNGVQYGFAYFITSSNRIRDFENRLKELLEFCRSLL